MKLARANSHSSSSDLHHKNGLDRQFQNTADKLFEALEKTASNAPNQSDDTEVVTLTQKMIVIDDRRQKS